MVHWRPRVGCANSRSPQGKGEPAVTEGFSREPSNLGFPLFGEVTTVGEPLDNGRVPITVATQQGDRTLYVQQQKGQ